MSYALLAGLLLLPLLGNVASTLLWRYTRIQPIAWTPRGFSAGLVLVLAWVLRSQQFEQVLGDWQPVSLTGSPLLLADNMITSALLIAWTSVQFYDAYVRRNDTQDWRLTDGVIAGGVHLAIVITALAQNVVTLLVGLGLIDLLTELRALQRQRHEGRSNTNLLFMAGSLAVLTAGMLLHAAQFNSLYFPLARLGAQTTNLLFVGIALRLWLLPIHTPVASYAPTPLPGWVTHGLGTLLLIAQLGNLGLGSAPTWLVTVLLMSAFLSLLQGVITQVPERARSALLVGTFQLACAGMALRDISTLAAAGLAWLLGNLLINHRPTANVTAAIRFGQIARIFGVLCLAGLPFTAGFVGYAGLSETLMRGAAIGLLQTVLLTLAHAAAITVALRVALNIPIEFDTEQQTSVPIVMLLPGLLAFLVVGAPLVLFGLAPGLLGRPGWALSNAELATWLSWGVALGLGIALWWLETRWLMLVDTHIDDIESVLNLGWLRSVLAGAFERLAHPLRSVFPFLESDGAMLWAVMVVLLLIVISRGAP